MAVTLSRPHAILAPCAPQAVVGQDHAVRGATLTIPNRGRAVQRRSRRHRLRLQPGAQAVSVRSREGQAAPGRGRAPERHRRDALRRKRHDDKFLLETIADMWGKAGIRARIEMMEMGARQRMLNERAVPPNGLLLGNPQSTLLDADGSLWRLWHPNGFNGKYWVGSQKGQRFHELMEQARYSLDPAKRRALYTEATQIIHGREAVARALPGSDRVRREPARQLQAAARLPADRVGDGA